MRITVALVAAVAAMVHGSPVAQGVTVPVAPSGSPPEGCSRDHSSYFGLSVQTIGSAPKAKYDVYRREARAQVITSISDGQIQAPTGSSTMSSPSSGYPSSVSSLSSSPTSSLSSSPISSLSSSPMSSLSSSPISSLSSSPISSLSSSPVSSLSSSPVSSVSSSPISSLSSSPVSSLSSPVSSPAGPSSPTSSLPTGPVSGGSSTSSTTTLTLTRTVMIDCSSTITSSVHGESTSMIPITQISDGQIQATNTTPDPKPYPTTIISSPVSQISDGQIQAPPARRTISPRHVVEVSEEGALGFIADVTVQPTKLTPYTCATNSTLTINLRNGVLTDRHERTGYVAGNYQVQFDAPPQHGALYTAGFSACSNGSLALGGSTVFWQCLSGNFYNIYDRYWAPQCQPIELVVTNLIYDC